VVRGEPNGRARHRARNQHRARIAHLQTKKGNRVKLRPRYHSEDGPERQG